MKKEENYRLRKDPKEKVITPRKIFLSYKLQTFSPPFRGKENCIKTVDKALKMHLFGL